MTALASILAGIDIVVNTHLQFDHCGGLTIDETAVVLEISPVTARRDYRARNPWVTPPVAYVPTVSP